MYRVVFGLFYLFSLLPSRILYLFSDFAYFLIYYVIGYRKDIVLNNLAIAFPEKTQQERVKIAKKFYRNFTDNFIEVIKLISASESFIKKRFTGDFSILKKLHDEGRRVQLHLGHNFNWEVANLGMTLRTPYSLLTVYMPITSKIIDRLFIYIRKRTGAKLLPATEMRNSMVPYRNKVYMLALVADQNPSNPKRAHWFNFFGRPTPFLIGPEKGAKGVNAAVVFIYFTKKKRGFYEAHFKLVTEDPANVPETQLTKEYVAFLEETIRQNPDMWLWSHRRWIWDWKPEYGPVIS